jgi:hypothetical protein
MSNNDTEALERGLALYRAMWEELASGNNLTDAQIAAAYHDPVLGVLWARIWDYAEYRSRTHQIRRIAHDDTRSVAIEEHQRRFVAEGDGFFRGEPRPAMSVRELVYQQAITPSTTVLKWRRRQRRKAA